MLNDSTTDAASGRLTEAELDQLDKCMEQLFHEALVTQSQVLLATHKELTDFRQTLTGEAKD